MKLVRTFSRLADIVLTTGAISCLVVLFNFLYLYGWTGSREFTSSSGPYLYYGLPALAAILLFAAFKLSSRQRIDIALCLCSAVFSIYAVEVFMTFWLNTATAREQAYAAASLKAARAQGLPFDTRSRLQVVHDLRMRGLDAMPSVFPRVLLTEQDDGTLVSSVSSNGAELLPLASISRKPTVVCNEGGQYMVYPTDAHGFNNPDAVWKERKADVVALGDSFTQGWCATPGKNFIDQVRQSYPAILNLGIEGNGPLMKVATLREYGQIFKPRIVLWLYYEGNDLTDLGEELKSPLLKEYLNPAFSQELINRQEEIDSVLTDYVERFMGKNKLLVGIEQQWSSAMQLGKAPHGLSGILKLSELRTRLGLVAGRGADSPAYGGASTDDSGQYDPVLDSFATVLSNAKRTVNAWGGEIYFVYLPQWARYANEDQSNLNPSRESVLKIVAAKGLPLIDMHEVFEEHPDPLALFPFRLGGMHYNDDGHSVVAKELLRAIVGETGD